MKLKVKFLLTYWNKGITPYYPNATFGVGFLLKNMATIHEEYLIYDAVNMIGSIGGTLGMCIGFCFTGVASFLISLLQKGIGKLRSFSKIPKVSPCTSKLQNEGEIYLQDKEKLEELMNAKFAVIEKKLEYLMNNTYNSSGQ